MRCAIDTNIDPHALGSRDNCPMCAASRPKKSVPTNDEIPAGSIRLDAAVTAAKRIVARINDGLVLPEGVQNDVIEMAVVILRLSGHQIIDKTGG